MDRYSFEMGEPICLVVIMNRWNGRKHTMSYIGGYVRSIDWGLCVRHVYKEMFFGGFFCTDSDLH